MSSVATIPEDYKFYDFLAPYRWPGITDERKAIYRQLIDDGDLHIETLLENALAVASQGQYKRIADKYRDFDDDSDAKKCISQHRNNDIKRRQWINSAAVTGLSMKKGLIRALVYSRVEDKFYFFAIPLIAYKGRNRVDILMDSSVGYKEPNGIPKGKWTVCQVDSFEELAKITHQEAEDRWNRYLNQNPEEKYLHLLLDGITNSQEIRIAPESHSDSDAGLVSNT
jgi:hypothetical protein